MLCWTVHLKVPRLILHAAVAVSHRVYSFGGYGHETTAHADEMSQVGYEDRRIGVPISVHVFNTVSLRWTRLPVATAPASPPPPDVPPRCPPEVPSHRVGLTAALIDGVVYIWGGLVNYWIEEADNGELTIYGKHCNALYTFDVETHAWARPPGVSGAVPEGRSVHSACVLGRVMYVFGGHKNQLTAFNDVHALDTAAMRWRAIDARGTPAPRAFGNSATAIGTRIFVFGGRWETRHYRSVSVFDTETDCWQSAPPMLTPDANVSRPLLPEARMNHSAVAHGGRLYVFGGDNNPQDRRFNDVWVFDPATFSWTKVEPSRRGGIDKAPGRMHRMCCVAVGDRLVLFGGKRTPSDLYVMDLSPSLSTLGKLAVLRWRLDPSGLPRDLRWEMDAMTSDGNRDA